MISFDLEKQLLPEIVAGVDEAGRGPLAGPVIAAAVILDSRRIPVGINDSKKLTKQMREKLFDEIFNTSLIGVGQASIYEIDELNILGATKLAMVRALGRLPTQPRAALIDGNQPPHHEFIKCIPIIKGDSKSLSIAAASIIAKVTRDRIMKELDLQFPEYKWKQNSGYGTKEHVKALYEFGASPHHRKSFAPVKDLV
jgi:ribonuclease HII